MKEVSITSERLIYDRVQNLSASAGTNNLRRKVVIAGEIEKYFCVSVENQTSAYTKLRIGVWDGAIFFPYIEEIAPLDGQIYFTDVQIIARQGMQLQAELQGCVAGDRLKMYILGIREPEQWEKSEDTKS